MKYNWMVTESKNANWGSSPSFYKDMDIMDVAKNIENDWEVDLVYDTEILDKLLFFIERDGVYVQQTIVQPVVYFSHMDAS